MNNHMFLGLLTTKGFLAFVLACVLSFGQTYLYLNSDRLRDKISDLKSENENLSKSLRKVSIGNLLLIERQKKMMMTISEIDQNSEALAFESLLDSNLKKNLIYELMSKSDHNLKKVKNNLADIDLFNEQNMIGNAMNSLKALKKNQMILDKSLNKIGENFTNRSKFLKMIPVIKPANGWVSSGFGSRKSSILHRTVYHKGIDIASYFGSPIIATASGVVKKAGFANGYGKYVEIDHKNGMSTVYAHAGSLLVRKGQEVERGQKIATVGLSGRTTGAHLHYEVRVKNKPIDPAIFIDGNVRARDIDEIAVALQSRNSSDQFKVDQRSHIDTARKNKDHGLSSVKHYLVAMPVGLCLFLFIIFGFKMFPSLLPGLGRGRKKFGVDDSIKFSIEPAKYWD